MDSSFLTFSPKITSRKKISSNNASRTTKSRLLKLNVQLEDTCSSPSNQHNIINNSRESNNSEKESDGTELLDDSVVFLCEKIKNDKYSSSCSPQPSSKEFRTSIKYPSLSSKHVKDKDLQNSEHDKFDKIRNWLNELQHTPERKMQIPVWTGASSSVIESSNSVEYISNLSNSKCIIPETSSDESAMQVSGKDQNQFSDKFDRKFQENCSNRTKTGCGKDDKMIQCSVSRASRSVGECTSYSGKNNSSSEICCDVVDETSHGSSTKLVVEKKYQNLAGNMNRKFEEKGNLSWRECESSSDDSWQPARRKRLGVIVIDSESDSENSNGSCANEYKKANAKSSSSKNCSDSSGKENIHKNKTFTCASVTSSDESNASSRNETSSERGGSKYDRDSVKTDDSIVSLNTAERFVSNVYGKSWDTKAVLTPILGKKELPLKKKNSEGDTASVEDLLSQFYGDVWDKEKVLTPFVNKKNNVKGKENTPPDVRKKRIINRRIEKVSPETDTPRNQISTPKSNIVSRRGLKNLKTLDQLSFLKSLSASPSPLRCNPRSLLYKREFRKYKEQLCCELFQLFNAEVFENKLPATLKIEWNLRMYTTAGFCKQKSILRPEGKIRTAVIQLSCKVCDSADRVRDTLIHELCHAAAWLIDGYKGGHGAQWRSWARKAMRRFPELPHITVCHEYKIQTKYIYKCKSCGYSIGRHSKSLDLSRKRCGLCFGEFELLVNSKRKTAETKLTSTPRTPRPPNGFALFVKDNYKTVKERNYGLKHADIMKILGKQFSGMKVGSDQQA